MSRYTWIKGRAGASQPSTSDSIMSARLAQYAPGTATTVRRAIIDWGIDLYADDATGAVNTGSPITLALYAGQSDTDDPTAPNFGPADNPNLGWWWWQGCWYGNPYISPTTGESNGVFSVNGRIDMRTQHDMIDSLYTTLWLVAEWTDIHGGWTTLMMQTWYQFLSAPTVG